MCIRDSLKEVTDSYGSQIALSLDLRGEEIQVEGWLQSGGKSIFSLFGELVNCRIGCMIVTDIERDGALEGVNLGKIKQLLEKASFPLIYSGGISTLDDIRAVASLRDQVAYSMLNGVIIGKALYEGKIQLREALKLAQGGQIHGSSQTLP
jgi:phosphoribosylformimino-5-aminoimidazole carboxamide ribonucleotide (ProFAR) isomerase